MPTPHQTHNVVFSLSAATEAGQPQMWQNFNKARETAKTQVC